MTYINIMGCRCGADFIKELEEAKVYQALTEKNFTDYSEQVSVWLADNRKELEAKDKFIKDKLIELDKTSRELIIRGNEFESQAELLAEFEADKPIDIAISVSIISYNKPQTHPVHSCRQLYGR